MGKAEERAIGTLERSAANVKKAREAFDGACDRHRQTIWSAYEKGVSVRQIAKACGTSESRVRQQLARVEADG